MRTSKPHRRIPIQSAVRMAIAAVVDSGRPLDLDAGDSDTSPTSLNLPAPEESTACLHHRHVCGLCDMPLRHNPE